MGKTLTQLKRELKLVKAKSKAKDIKLMKAAKKAKEIAKVKKELAMLRQSPFLKKVKKLSKRRLTDSEKEMIIMKAKKAKKKGLKLWTGLGKVVNRLDRLGN